MTKPRPAVVHGSTKKISTGCGKLYVTLNRDEEGTPIEVFVKLGKAGGCANSQTEALGRLISILLKHGVDISEVIKSLSGIGCHQPTFIGDGKKTLSCADAVAFALSKLIEIKEETKPKPVPALNRMDQAQTKEKVIPKIDFEKLHKETSKIATEWNAKKEV